MVKNQPTRKKAATNLVFINISLLFFFWKFVWRGEIAKKCRNLRNALFASAFASAKHILHYLVREPNLSLAGKWAAKGGAVL